MLSVKISGKVLTFKFSHIRARMGMGGELVTRRVTICSVHSRPDAVRFERAYSVCHPTDQFSRRVGRKIALKKLLQKLFPDRSIYLFHRQRVWDAYFALELRGEWAG